MCFVYKCEDNLQDPSKKKIIKIGDPERFRSVESTSAYIQD